MIYKVKIKSIYHNNEERWGLYFKNNARIEKGIKSLEGAHYSNSLKCWHIPKDLSIEDLNNKFNGKINFSGTKLNSLWFGMIYGVVGCILLSLSLFMFHLQGVIYFTAGILSIIAFLRVLMLVPPGGMATFNLILGLIMIIGGILYVVGTGTKFEIRFEWIGIFIGFVLFVIGTNRIIRRFRKYRG